MRGLDQATARGMTPFRTLVERYLDAYNDRDFDRWGEFLDDHVVVVADAGTFHGRDAARAFAAQTALNFPGVKAELERVVSEASDSIAVEYRLTNPDGSPHDWLLAGTVCDIYDIADGRIARVHTYYLRNEADHTQGAQIPSRAQATQIADERQGLARLARLLASDVSQDEICAAATGEVARLIGGQVTAMLRFDDDAMTLVAATGAERWPFPVGERRPLDAGLREICDRGVPRRFTLDASLHDGPLAAEARALGIGFMVAVPILVSGATWGAMISAGASVEPPPDDTEARIAGFNELIAAAIARTQARGELAELLAEQAALRRVATLVANGARPSEIFAVTAAEIRNLLSADAAVLWRYESNATATVIALESDRPLGIALGMQLPIEGDSAMAKVYRTGELARQNELNEGAGAIAAAARTNGLRTSLGAPITVDGRRWGAVVASSRQADMPDETARRTVGFTELLATAIANADSRSQLLQSRARMLTAADDARRRVARDLHDGAQQRLVHTILTLKLARRALDADTAGERPLETLVADALEQAESANAELRDLSHGILPIALTHHGLRAAIDDLVARAGVPVAASVTAARLPPAVEASAYFVVAESLTNVAKHAHATRASLQAWIDETTFYLEVRDDGIGGARLDGTGLLGLQDRVTALGGRLRLESPSGGGTWIRVELPVSFR